jgi:hypothetical protein
MLEVLTLEVNDEILSEEPLYTIKDSLGNVLYENVKINLNTNISQEGTEINKELFDKIDENFERIKKYLDFNKQSSFERYVRW